MTQQCWKRVIMVTFLSMLQLLLVQIMRIQQDTNIFSNAWMVPDVLVGVTTSSRTTSSSSHLFLTTPQPLRRSDSGVFSFSRIPKNHQALQMAGFGDAASSSSNESKDVKLKPKQQWDRYTTLKKENSVVVGVKVVVAVSIDTEETASDWLVVGAVKSESTIPIDVAVARQRALLVEVCIMHPYYVVFNICFLTFTFGISFFPVAFGDPPPKIRYKTKNMNVACEAVISIADISQGAD